MTLLLGGFAFCGGQNLFYRRSFLEARDCYLPFEDQEIHSATRLLGDGPNDLNVQPSIGKAASEALGPAPEV